MMTDEEIRAYEEHMRKPTVLQGGEVLYGVHAKHECQGPFCPIHNPSDHPLKDAPQHWRGDRGIMERICAHGVGHPDPDGLFPAGDRGIHGCDGCCR